jgi:hypothetical protein
LTLYIYLLYFCPLLHLVIPRHLYGFTIHLTPLHAHLDNFLHTLDLRDLDFLGDLRDLDFLGDLRDLDFLGDLYIYLYITIYNLLIQIHLRQIVFVNKKIIYCYIINE